jgi:hypothetical protein
MGGFGSTRWDAHTKANTVEDCRSLDIGQWVREGTIRPGYHLSGSWKWSDARTGETTSVMGYESNALDPAAAWLRLYYTFTRTGESFDYRVRLQTTRPRYGGLRWWFTCPLVVNGRACERRVGKLYLPPGCRYYGCRVCYRLSYTSCQEHDSRVDRLVRDPVAFEAACRAATFDSATPGGARTFSKMGLVLKAERVLRKRLARYERRR